VTGSRDGPGAPRAWLALALGIACCAGCVSTEGDAPGALPLCVAPRSESRPADAVVQVVGDLGRTGKTLCSGVLVAPHVVLTNHLCVVAPVGLRASDLALAEEPPPAFLGYALYSADIDYEAYCRSGAVWAPQEDGDLGAWLNDPIDASRLTVKLHRDGQDLETSAVRRVLLPNAGSRCWDALAAVVIEEPLSAGVLPVRLAETSHAGEPATLAGFGFSDDSPYELPTSIASVTFESGNPDAPPRSLLLEDQICVYETGGPLVSDESGEVVGVVAYGTGSTCGDPAGRTIATRLAPFRRLLFEAARAAGEDLRTVIPTDPVDRAVPDCSASSGAP
jgi:Trypsin